MQPPHVEKFATIDVINDVIRLNYPGSSTVKPMDILLKAEFYSIIDEIKSNWLQFSYLLAVLVFTYALFSIIYKVYVRSLFDRDLSK